MLQVTRGNSVQVPLTVNMPGLCSNRQHGWDISITFFSQRELELSCTLKGKY